MNFSVERCNQEQFIPTWMRHEHLARYRFAASYVARKVVVDCACGDGTSSELFAKAHASHVFAFDVEPGAIEYCKRNRVDCRLSFAKADASTLPLDDAVADVYVSLETIEHLQNDRAFLQEVVRVLKRGGLFICSTPNRLVKNPGKTIADKPFNPFHFREYSQEEFAALLDHFFKEIEWFGQNKKSRWLARMIGVLGKVLPRNSAVRINQMMKLPRFLFDRLEDHRVFRTKDAIVEYMVAVCREPRKI